MSETAIAPPPFEASRSPELVRERTHIPSLDGIRGLAILLVMASHYLPMLLGADLLGRTLGSGWIGVDLFFVLSGFLITGILANSKESAHYYRNFYVRRGLRIFPLYYATMVLFAFLLPRLHLLNSADHRLGKDQVWLWFFGANFLVAKHGWYHLNVFWSLAVEEHFYLVWPAVVASFSRRTTMIICLALIVVTIPIRIAVASWDTNAAYVLTPCRMDGLAIGALIALAIRGPGGLEAVARIARPLLVISGVPLLILAVHERGLSFSEWGVILYGYPLLGWFFGSLLVCTLDSTSNRGLNAFFAHPVMRFFGKYSYGLYIYHHVTMPFFFTIFNPTRIARIIGSISLGGLMYVVIAVSGAILISVLSFHYFEQPFLRLKRYFPD